MTQETLERIKLEKNELDEKIEKLKTFLFTNKRYRLSKANYFLLSNQYDVMGKYSAILQCRIELNEKNIEDEK